MTQTITKREGIHISLAAVLAWIPLIPVFWFIAKPVLIGAVSDAVADDIQTQVKAEVKPLNSAFKVLLKNDIDNNRKQIAALEFKRDRHSDNWTEGDASLLIDLKIELDA
ncbi:hypothetical protein LCGC14_2538580, partial [marine sediment metagenome]